MARTEWTCTDPALAIPSFRGEWLGLSNFAPCVITLDGVRYASVEHAYQAAKTENLAQRENVRRARTASIAKREGRFVTLRDGWDDLKVEVMRGFLRQKFAPGQPHDYVLLLQRTGQKTIVEGNYWGDRFWGAELDGTVYVGENWLGVLLMQVRDEIEDAELRKADV